MSFFSFKAFIHLLNIQFTMQNTNQIPDSRRFETVKLYKKSSFVDICESLQSLRK